MRQKVNRRDVLLGGTASALTLGVAAGSLMAQEGTKSLTIGMATTQFKDYSNLELATELSAQGIHTIQFFLTQTDSDYWKYGRRSDLVGLTGQRCAEIADIYRSAGISIHSIGVYVNLVHGDKEERKANLEYFEKMMKVGEHMGVRTFVSEVGHYHPEGPAPAVPYDFQDEVWVTTVATVKELARVAEAHDATVLLEPIYRSVLASAKRTRIFLEEVDSARVRTLLDAANLLEVNDLGEMFDQLQPWIGCLHAKDRKLHVTRGVAAGQGDLDYREFVSLAAERTPDVPLVLEYVGSNNYQQALAHLRTVMSAVGVTEG